jgi:putative FmdB family regulatory protein
MPTYEYECTVCSHQFEAFQKITDAPLSKCPQCGKKVKRLISAGLGIIFKGSGFYTTDYKKSSAAASSSVASKQDKKKTAEDNKSVQKKTTKESLKTSA